MAFQFKRGDTFSFSGQVEVLELDTPVLDLTGWTGKSQIRLQATGALIAELQFSWLNAAQRIISLTKSATETQTWPLGVAEIDIQFTNPAGEVVSTQTEAIQLVKDITYV